MDYRTYLIKGKSQKYDDNVARKTVKCSKRLSAPMRSQTFDAAKLITIMKLLNKLKLTCDTNGMRECATMCFINQFMKKPSSEVLDTCTCMKTKKKRLQSEETLMTYFVGVIYLLTTSATDVTIGEADAAMPMSKQPPNMILEEYSQSQWLKPLKCGSVYEVSRLKGKSMEGLHGSICHSMRAHCRRHKRVALQELGH